LYPIFALPLAQVIKSTWGNGVRRLLLCQFLALALLFSVFTMLGYWHGSVPYSGASASDALRAVMMLGQ
jgi:hypothetical protein